MRSSPLILMVMGMCGLALLCTAQARAAEQAAEQMDNPQFKAWKNFGIGSSETLEATAAGPNGTTMTIDSTHKLLEKTDDHVTLEISATMNMMGQSHTMQPQKRTVQAKVEKRDYKQIGTEDVQAAGKTISCKVYEGKGIAPPSGRPGQQGGDQQETRVAKVWASDEVPGGLVKMEAQSERGKITMTLKSYEAK